MIQENINPYNEKKFKLEFESSLLYKQIYNDFDIISYKDDTDSFKFKKLLGYDQESFKKIFEDERESFKFLGHVLEFIEETITPRGWLSFSIFDAVPLYYLKYLTDLNPAIIYDIGCGCNIFKKYIPNIQGIDIPALKNDLIKNYADIYDDSLINNSFYVNNFEKFDSAFSICSLHFYSLLDIRKRVIQFSSLISKGGRGFIALNIARMLECCLKVESIDFSKLKANQINQIDQFVRKELYNLPFKIEVFESYITKGQDNWLNGNVRIVFTKV